MEQEEKEEAFASWDESIKKRRVDDLDNRIGKLEARMTCINRALNIGDLAACMK
jgi:hypothetical protein